MRLHGRQSFAKELLGPDISVVMCSAPQARCIIRRDAFAHASKHFVFAFGKAVEIVDKIDQHKFSTKRLWKGWPHAKIKCASAKREVAMPFVIVDHGLVVKLRRADAKHIVGIRRSEKEAI